MTYKSNPANKRHSSFRIAYINPQASRSRGYNVGHRTKTRKPVCLMCITSWMGRFKHEPRQTSIVRNLEFQIPERLGTS